MTSAPVEITLVPFNREMLAGFNYNGVEVGLFDNSGEVIDTAERFARSGRCLMGVWNGTVFALGGIFPANSWGVGYSWAFIKADMLHLGLDIVRAIREREPEFCRDMGLRRIYTEVVAGSDKAIAFVELLGYEREGLLRKHAANGADVYIYAKLMEV